MSGYRAKDRDSLEYRSSQHDGRRTSNKERSEYSQGGSSSPPRRTSQKYSTASRNEDLRPFSYGIFPQQRKEGRDSSPSQQWEEPVNRRASSFNTDPSSRTFREMGSSGYERRPSNIMRSGPAEVEPAVRPLKARNVVSGSVQEPSLTARQRPTRTSEAVEMGIVFLNERNFCERTKFFVKKGFEQKKTKLIVQKMKKLSFLKNEGFKIVRTNLK